MALQKKYMKEAVELFQESCVGPAMMSQWTLCVAGIRTF